MSRGLRTRLTGMGRLGVATALGAALLFGASPVLRSLHFIVVQHAWCAEHQAFAHVAGDEAGAVRETPEGHRAACSLIPNGPIHDNPQHSGCDGSTLLPERATLQRLARADLPAPSLPLAQALSVTAALTSDTILLAAPKQSPPA